MSAVVLFTFAGLIIAVGITGSLGWWLGEIILSQLKRMGYWATER